MKYKKTMIIIIPIIIILLVIFGWIVALKITVSSFKPTEGSLPMIINSEESIKQGQLITIMTWNLGYGGLGKNQILSQMVEKAFYRLQKLSLPRI